jgi:hypothetical protein
MLAEGRVRADSLRKGTFKSEYEVACHLECDDLSSLSLPHFDLASTTDQQKLAAQVADATRESGDESPQSKDWPHAPLHRLDERGTYIVTAGTLHKQHWFRGPDRLDLMECSLLRTAQTFGWQNSTIPRDERYGTTSGIRN